jgi:type 1 glutamine amidotransferase
MVIYSQDRFELPPRQWTVSDASEIYQLRVRATFHSFSDPRLAQFFQSRPTLTMETFPSGCLQRWNFSTDGFGGIQNGHEDNVPAAYSYSPPVNSEWASHPFVES